MTWAVFVLLSVGCGASEGPSVPAVQPERLVDVLIDWRDRPLKRHWSGRDERPAVTSEEYSEPPTQLCPDGAEVSLVGEDSIYYSITNDDYVWASEWVSGETVEAAADRMSAGRAAFATCPGYPTWTAVPIQREGIEEVHRFRGFEGVNDPAGIELIYARNGGVIVLLAVTGNELDWLDGEKDAVIETALARLAELRRVEVDPTRSDQLPLPTTIAPDPALSDVLLQPADIAGATSFSPIPTRSTADEYNEPTEQLFHGDPVCRNDYTIAPIAEPAVMSSLWSADSNGRNRNRLESWASAEGPDDAAVRMTASVGRLTECYAALDGWDAQEIVRPGIDAAWQFQHNPQGTDSSVETIVYARREGVLSLLWIEGDDAAWAPARIEDIVSEMLDRLAVADLPAVAT